MLNNILVPNKYICPGDPQTIDWNRVKEIVNLNFEYDKQLINEARQLNNLRPPYSLVDEGVPPQNLKLHDYFTTTSAIDDYPTDDAGGVRTIPANSIVVRFTITDNPYADYVVLERSQTFFQYTPLTQTSYTYSWSPYDPEKDKCYIRPVGEWARITSHNRIPMTTTTQVLNGDEIVYDFSAGFDHLTAPAWFTTDHVCAVLYLSDDSTAEPIARVPASIGHQIIRGVPQITLNLHTTTVPSSFFVEVF